MNGLSFEILSRFAPGAMPHLAGGGEPGTARVAPLAGSVTAEAKNKKKSSNRKARKKAEQQCKNQVERCITGVTPQCKGRPECLAAVQQCCPMLESCNAIAFLDCIGF